MRSCQQPAIESFDIMYQLLQLRYHHGFEATPADVTLSRDN